MTIIDATRNRATAEQAISAVETACKHTITMKSGSMWSSAVVCIIDARTFLREGKYHLAHSWALRSLSYSVEENHPDYIRIAKEQ